MIETYLKKTRRYLEENKALQIKLVLIVAFLISAAVLSVLVGKQEKELARVKAQKELADRLPVLKTEWETKWKAQMKAEWDKNRKNEDLKSLTPEEQIEAIQRILEGTSYQNGVYQAVINGEIYAVGNQLGDYTITKITMEAITLEDKERNDVQQLLFPEETRVGMPEEEQK